MIKRTFVLRAQHIRCALGIVALLCGWLMASGSLLAHHSLAGVYDMKSQKELSGTVTKMQFTNPHGTLGISVKNDDGSTTEWVLTLGSATALAQRGIGKTGPNALRVGDAIKVKFLPAKNGAPLGALRVVIFPDGHEIQTSGSNPND
jgi:hypothetical protein